MLVKIVGGYVEVESPTAPGGSPPGIWPSPGYPAHPIAPGGPPPGIWPSPGTPTHPIYWPSVPTHPIVLPPAGENPPEGSIPPVVEWHTLWTEQYGWVLVGVPTNTHPSPSR